MILGMMKYFGMLLIGAFVQERVFYIKGFNGGRTSRLLNPYGNDSMEFVQDCN
ncbi:hypothetical protein [Cytobacillus solani]|uniref:hypothetical protein n=1 Tax=Cytobacillus solani TaxID=1637975 RepID=UPI000A45B6A5|nr:hypothetical protein [Cytobacillus solani]